MGKEMELLEHKSQRMVAQVGKCIVIKLLDGMSGQLRRGRYPSDDMARKGAAVLRAVADDLDV